MNQPDGILNTNLVEVGNKYITNRDRASVGDLFLEKGYYMQAYAELFEQLLLFERVSIVLGPLDNSAVAVLANGFGSLRELERAIKLETIEIVQPRTMTMLGLGPHGAGEHDPSLLLGLPPILAGQMHFQDLGDPEVALLDGLRHIHGVSEGDKRGFAKRVARYVKPGSLNSDDEAIRMVMNAYESDLLRPVGMPFVGNARALDAQQRMRLHRFVSEMDDLLFVAENNYGVYGRSRIYDLAKASIGKIEELLEVQRSTDHILDHLVYPNLRLLYEGQRAAIKHAIDIRETDDGIFFRRWIHENADPEERRFLLRKFLEATPIGFPTTKVGELSKGVVMNAFGKIPGAAAAATGAYVGAVVGGPVGAVVGAAAGFGTEVIGAYLLDKMAAPFTKGFVPKMFTDRIKKLALPEPTPDKGFLSRLFTP